MNRLSHISIIIMLFLTTATSANAHILEANNSVGVMMHIDPNDEPVADEPATILLEFKDKDALFSLDNCDCRIRIVTAGKEIDQKKLSGTDSQTAATIQYTFPEKNTYHIEIAGTPISEDTFKPFTITYDIAVQQNIKENKIQEKQTSSIFLPFVIIALILSSASLILSLRRK